MRATTAISVVLGAVSLAGAALSVRFGIWSRFAPGPGLFPLTASSIMMLSLVMSGRHQDGGNFGVQEIDARRLALYVGAILAFTLSIHLLGMLPAIFLFVAFVVGVIERLGWRKGLVVATASMLACWLVFGRLLSVPLPAAVWS